MKILFLIRSLENGGAERQLALLANELGKRGHGVMIGVLHAGGIHEKSVRPEYVRVVHLERAFKWNLIGFAMNLLRLVRSERPDIIHGYLSAGNVAATLGQLFRPSSKLVWGIRDSSMGADNYGRTTRFASRLLRITAARVHLMIFNSQAGYKSWAVSGFAANNSVCLPNGIDVDEFAPDREAGVRYRNELGIPLHVPLVGMVARLDPAKDHASFLAAAAKVSQTAPGTRFLCLGEGPITRRADLIMLAERLGIGDRVYWPHSTRSMRDVYNALDVMCLASHEEGFPNVVAEAMACGRPCVVTGVGDVAFVAGQAARVVPPRDPDALAAALLETLLEGEPSGDSPRSRIVENFALQTLAARTEAALLTA